MFYIKTKNNLYKQVTISALIKKLHDAKSQITLATDYDEYLKNGNGCDSSDDCHFRMGYVYKAEHEFLSNNKWYILTAAAKLVQDDIDHLNSI